MVGQELNNPWAHGDERLSTLIREGSVSVRLAFEALTIPPREWPIRPLTPPNVETYYQQTLAAFMRLVGY